VSVRKRRGEGGEDAFPSATLCYGTDRRGRSSSSIWCAGKGEIHIPRRTEGEGTGCSLREERASWLVNAKEKGGAESPLQRPANIGLKGEAVRAGTFRREKKKETKRIFPRSPARKAKGNLQDGLPIPLNGVQKKTRITSHLPPQFLRDAYGRRLSLTEGKKRMALVLAYSKPSSRYSKWEGKRGRTSGVPSGYTRRKEDRTSTCWIYKGGWGL